MVQTRIPATAGQAAVPATAQRPPGQPSAALAVPERPVRAPHVQLSGEMPGTGFTERQWLLQRHGQFIQATELLYRILEQANGERTLAEIAAGVTEATAWTVTAEQVRQLIQTKLLPLGLIATVDGTVAAPGAGTPRSALRLTFRKTLIGPRLIEPLAKGLQVLYAPPVLIPVLLAIAGAHVWLYVVHGMADSVHAALNTPGGLLVVLVLLMVAGLFHELGHATGLRYGGGSARGIGAGLYLVYPAFYTDTTDAYRLGRWARVRTDLGGFYFHLIFALYIMALYVVSGQEVLLAVVLLINVDILYQLLPFVRFDGYWALADLTGIPDFFSQMGPFVRSVLPLPGGAGSKLPPLQPRVKTVFALYILLTVPVLALLYVVMLAHFPRFMALGWQAVLAQTRWFTMAQSTGDVMAMAAVVTQLLLLMLSMVGSVYVLYSASRRPLRALWHWSQPTPRRRLAGALAAVGAGSLVAFLWAPQLPFVSRAGPAGPAAVQRFEISERLHVETPVTYAQTPPVGGNHAPVWQNCGFYDTPIANENAVHSLEHGAVWLTYRPDLAPDQVEALRRLARRQSYVLVSPLAALPAPVVAVAWGRQLPLESVDDPRLAEFVRAFRLSRHAPERGGPCTRGRGTPA